MRARSLLLRLEALFRRQRVEHETDEELDFHLEMQARKHRAAGLDPARAMQRARLEFGNVGLVKEDVRTASGVQPIHDFLTDLRYAARGVRRAPAFALAVMLTVGLGVGIVASVFSVFDAYVLRPFDVRDPYSLYSVVWMDRRGHAHEFTRDDYDSLRRRNRVMSDVVAYRTLKLRLDGIVGTVDAVTENFFDMAGIRPALGRLFVPEDKSAAVVVLSHVAWQTRYGADSSIIGRRIAVRGHAFEVVGVAQEGFGGFFKKPRDFWVPLSAVETLDAARVAPSERREDVSLLARLRPAVSPGEGQGYIASVLQSITSSLPDSSRVAHVMLSSRATPSPRSFGSYLLFVPLAVAFALVLALACANVANMLLARGYARQRELGTRLALGASRGRLVRQLVTESVVLALPAAIIGFLASWVAVDGVVRALFATLPPDLTAFVRLVPLHPDVRVFTFACVAAVGSAVVFGLAPALHSTQFSVAKAIRGTFASERSSSRLRNAFIVGQIAGASLFLILAGILLREASRLGRVDVGLHTKDVVSVEVSTASRSAVLARLRESPVVDTLATSSVLPLDMRFPTVAVTAGESPAHVDALYTRVSSAYFAVLGIGVVSGRVFTPQEEAGAAPAVILSEGAARRLAFGGNALGRTIRLDLPNDATGDTALRRLQGARVVGLVRDVVVGSLETGKDQPLLYFPTTLEHAGCCLLARVRGDPAVIKRALDLDLERSVPGGVDRIDRLETFVAGAIYPYRVAYWVALALGLIALGMTVVGVYGVVSFVVGQRTREIGVRIALGATTRNVLRLVLRQSFRQALIGGAIGSALALGVARILASNIEQMPAFDLVAFAVASACVLICCLAAAFVPSWRAAKIEPSATLRCD